MFAWESKEKYFEDIAAVYHSVARRFDTAEWAAILQKLGSLGFDDKNLGWETLVFFLEHPFIPQTVWSSFAEYFLWTDNVTAVPWQLRDSIPTLRREMDPENALPYDGLVGTPGCSDRYLGYRRSLRDAILENREADVERYFRLAAAVYDKDPTLFLMAFSYYDRIQGRREKASVLLAWNALSGYLALCPDSPRYEKYRVEYMYLRGFATEALAACDALIAKYPSDLSCRQIEMDLLIQMREPEKARRERYRIRKEYAKILSRAKKNPTVDSPYSDENRRLVDTMNASYPDAWPWHVKGRRLLLILIAILILLCASLLLTAGQSLRQLLPRNASAATASAEKDSSVTGLIAQIQIRHLEEIYSYELSIGEGGTKDVRFDSETGCSEETKEAILSEIAGFVRSYAASFPDADPPVDWRVTFDKKGQKDAVYISDPSRIVEEDADEGAIWTQLM